MHEQLEEQLLSILAECSDTLPTTDIDNIRELFLVGEYSVGYENLCTQLYEYEVKIRKDFYGRLASLGELMQLDKSTWEILEELIY
jgi:hypothetical protein